MLRRSDEVRLTFGTLYPAAKLHDTTWSVSKLPVK